MNARAWWVGSCHKSCSLRADDEEGEYIQHGLPQNTDHSENGHLPCMDGGSWISWICSENTGQEAQNTSLKFKVKSLKQVPLQTQSEDLHQQGKV